MLIDFISFIFSIMISGCLALSAYFIGSSRKKLLEEDVWHALFWLFGSLAYFSMAFALGLRTMNPSVSNYLSYIFIGWLGFHGVSAVIYLVTKITKNFLVKIIARIASGLILAYWLFYIVPQTQIVFRSPQGFHFDFPILYEAFLPYFTVGLVFGFSFLIILIIWQQFKKGLISLENLSRFYNDYALMVYLVITLPKVLYILPVTWFFDVFFLLIPYLTYLRHRTISVS